MADSDRIQDLTSRLFAAKAVADEALEALAKEYGEDATSKLREMQAHLLNRFKNSGIPAERELEHAKIVGPSLDIINIIFAGVLTGGRG